VIVKYRITWT